MERTKILQLLTSLEVEYPNSFKNFSKEMFQAKAKQWEHFFKDTSDESLVFAVEFYIANNKTNFPPSIGQLNDIIKTQLVKTDDVTEEWEKVNECCRNVYDRESANTQWKTLSAVTQSFITPQTLLTWRNDNRELREMRYRKWFYETFENRSSAVQSIAVLPSTARQMLPNQNIVKLLDMKGEDNA